MLYLSKLANDLIGGEENRSFVHIHAHTKSVTEDKRV